MIAAWLWAGLLSEAIALPGGPPVGMDYAVYDATERRLWMPAGNTGHVDVIDTRRGSVTALGSFATKPGRPGRPKVGPSSATLAGVRVWIGSRGDDTLCSFDAHTLKQGACVALPSMPDGVAYVAGTHELWITTPHEQRLTIVGLDAQGSPVVPPSVGALKVPGDPEGYAVDQARGIFYTNLEDKDETLAFDVKTRKLLTRWPAGCGEQGPRGLALDLTRKQLFVACTDGAVVLDLAHGGHRLSRVTTGGGVDNLDYDPKTHLLYVASGHDGVLTWVRVAENGTTTIFGHAATAPGARNAVLADDGTAYVPDAVGGRLIVVKTPNQAAAQ